MTPLAVLVAIAIGGSSSVAYAVSEELKKACGADYAAYCAEHAIGTAELKACMRAHRKRLTKVCHEAIAVSGEVTLEEIRAHKREMEAW